MPIRDSKQVDDKEERQMLADYVKESAIAWAAVEMPIEVIDEKNIDYANFIGMQRAMDELAAKVEKLKQEEPEEKHKIPSVTHVLIDGKRFWPHKTITHECVVKGDSKHLSIAAASLIAKTTRDARIAELVKDNEELLKPYHVEENIGYFSAIHMSALKEHGPTALHRLSYQPCYDGAMKHWAGNAEKMKLLHQRAGNSTAAKKYARKQAKAEK
jgi:ribonuclease HII